MSTISGLLGHADVRTTQIYTGASTLDELAAAIDGFRFAATSERTICSTEAGNKTRARTSGEAPTGIEPVYTALQAQPDGSGGL